MIPFLCCCISFVTFLLRSFISIVSFSLRYFHFPPWFFSLAYWRHSICCLISKNLGTSHIFSVLISNLIVFREKVLYSFNLFKLLKFIHYLDYGLSLKWNHMFFKRICILLPIYSILFINGKSGWLMVLFSSMICWIFVKKFFFISCWKKYWSVQL